jgi:hypothetical protein
MEQLQPGLSVVVERVNPSALTRDAWMGTASAGGGDLLEVELLCSDEREHQRRVTRRCTDVDGLVKPTWPEASDRECEPWSRDHLVIDTATMTPHESAARIAAAMDSARGRWTGAGLELLECAPRGVGCLLVMTRWSER